MCFENEETNGFPHSRCVKSELLLASVGLEIARTTCETLGIWMVTDIFYGEGRDDNNLLEC